MSIKVVVTGANGQLGKTLKDLFQTHGDSIEMTFVTKSELDVSDNQALVSYFEHYTFDYCINCAAYTNVDQAEESVQEAFKINAVAVKYLAECCKEHNTTLIHISTDYVFDGTKKTPYLETDTTNPINQYGESKLAGEKNIQETLNHFFIIRTSWLYSRHPKNFVTTIMSKIQEDADLTITTSQRGTPTSCIELSKFIYWLILENSQYYGIYHFSAKGEATWFEFALKIAESFPEYQQKKITSTDLFKSKATRPNYSVMDNSKVQNKYHYQNHWTVDAENVLKGILNNNDTHKG